MTIIIKEKGFQIEGAWEELGKHWGVAGRVHRRGWKEEREGGKWHALF